MVLPGECAYDYCGFLASGHFGSGSLALIPWLCWSVMVQVIPETDLLLNCGGTLSCNHWKQTSFEAGGYQTFTCVRTTILKHPLLGQGPEVHFN